MKNKNTIFVTTNVKIDMENLYDVNGLLFWSENDIKMRSLFEDFFVGSVKKNLKGQNRAFDFYKCEAPLLTPTELINPNYTDEDVWVQKNNANLIKLLIDYAQDQHKIEADADRLLMLNKEHMRPVDDTYYLKMIKLHTQITDNSQENSIDGSLLNEMTIVYNELYPQKTLVLRPETTMGSYAYARHLLNPHRTPKIQPPLVVYQHGKSFRKEQDQPTKYMRLKEFYQLEFQIIYSPSTKNDYSLTLIEDVKDMISKMIGPCFVESSDRLPSYAEWTMDVICEKTKMEVCSISKRTDFEGMNVLEIAIGTDRCLYNFNNK